jgi:hypothetical protein
MIKSRSIEDQTKMYLYDLMNTAKEHGFKADDSWELSMATNLERIKIQRDYYPAIATKVTPELLLQVYNLTKAKLNQDTQKDANSNQRTAADSEVDYLVAFNPKRPRT